MSDAELIQKAAAMLDLGDAGGFGEAGGAEEPPPNRKSSRPRMPLPQGIKVPTPTPRRRLVG